jgi:hypothetical protein
MFAIAESKAQGWRAVAVFEDGSESLLFVGMSSTQIRSGYASSFRELLDAEERDSVREIRIEQWYGAPDAGKWMEKGKLRIPEPKLAKIAA